MGRREITVGILEVGRAGDHLNYVQPELLGEGEVALVVGGYSHDGPGAIVHHHVVGHVDRDQPSGYRVDRVAAGEHAGLLLLDAGPLDGGSRHGFCHVTPDLLLLGQAARPVLRPVDARGPG